MWQNAAFILIGLGLLALIEWAVEGFFISSEIHIMIRIAVGIIGLGILILIGVAIRDRKTIGIVRGSAPSISART